MNAHSFHILLNDDEKQYMKIKLKINPLIKQEYINHQELEELQELKNRIFNSANWDKHKKFSNDYELIHIPNKRNRTDSIAYYQPLSRSYFKMIELIYDYNLLSNYHPKFKTSHLAEGPGGFMEATFNLTSRRDTTSRCQHYGITLYSENKDIPGWNKAYDFLFKNNNIHISYGADNTGDLYKANNIKHFVSFVKRGTCDFVTADGGFDFSIDFNKQEQLSYKLILCEIITCLFIQKIGGHFVCKFFDIYTLETVKLLYFLSCFYEEVYISKPYTSRPANSEKYIICKNFTGIDYEYLDTLLLSLQNPTVVIHDIFDFKIPPSFLNQIKSFNKINTKFQVNTIEYTLNLIEKKKNLSFLNNIIENQVKKAKEWCEKYKVKINYRSTFVTKYT
jgi:23S rRNA U2552 (ribose-2'-O)-methylase RlmE/FtsJ